MRKSRYIDSQIISLLKQSEAGTPVPDLCREHGMSGAMFVKIVVAFPEQPVLSFPGFR